MVKRILAAGIQARYLLMDSWFAMPATITAIAKNIDVIGMVKKTPKIHYEYNGHWIDVKAIYRRLKKHRGRARILASALVTLMTLAGNRLKALGNYCEKTETALFDTIMETALQCAGLLGKRKLGSNF